MEESNTNETRPVDDYARPRGGRDLNPPSNTRSNVGFVRFYIFIIQYLMWAKNQGNQTKCTTNTITRMSKKKKRSFAFCFGYNYKTVRF